MKINYKKFQEIVHTAEKQPNQQIFVTEWVASEIAENENQAVELITTIHTITHATPAELIKLSGMKQTQFAARFMIPLRTVQNWAGNQRSMRKYEKFMIAEILGLFGDLEITAE